MRGELFSRRTRRTRGKMRRTLTPLSASFCVFCGLNPCNLSPLCYISDAGLFFEMLLARPVSCAASHNNVSPSLSPRFWNQGKAKPAHAKPPRRQNGRGIALSPRLRGFARANPSGDWYFESLSGRSRARGDMSILVAPWRMPRRRTWLKNHGKLRQITVNYGGFVAAHGLNVQLMFQIVPRGTSRPHPKGAD
jgi:hypothetical protein